MCKNLVVAFDHWRYCNIDLAKYEFCSPAKSLGQESFWRIRHVTKNYCTELHSSNYGFILGPAWILVLLIPVCSVCLHPQDSVFCEVVYRISPV